MTTNIYRSLEGAPGAIRLLQVLPGDDDDELECRLYETTLGPDLSYTALSYVWENHLHDTLGTFTPPLRTEKAVIRCDGKQIEIGTNLNSALQRLRDKKDVVQLWVDKLCIDQEDVTERNHQVALMRNIYEDSQEVVIWLGDRPSGRPPHEEGVAFALISRLAAGRHIISQGVFQTDLWTSSPGEQKVGSISELQRMMAVSWVSHIKSDHALGTENNAVATNLGRPGNCGILEGYGSLRRHVIAVDHLRASGCKFRFRDDLPSYRWLWRARHQPNARSAGQFQSHSAFNRNVKN